MGIESKMDKVVEKADLVYSTAADRAVERMEEAEGNVDKDIEIQFLKNKKIESVHIKMHRLFLYNLSRNINRKKRL
mgnify:CR=1 FL=1